MVGGVQELYLFCVARHDVKRFCAVEFIFHWIIVIIRTMCMELPSITQSM